MDKTISMADVEQTIEDNILCYTHSDRPIDQDPDTECHMAIRTALRMLRKDLRKLPPTQPERDTPKRVVWTGWKGHRYTRYNCPNCKKPVRNDDVYCHRCGQRLAFPKVSHTPYVEGKKQEVIVRWEDEVTE